MVEEATDANEDDVSEMYGCSEDDEASTGEVTLFVDVWFSVGGMVALGEVLVLNPVTG